jgi:hypothetical protein
MIKVLGRNFATIEKAIAFLKISIKMESSEKIRKQLIHKLDYLMVDKELKDEKEKKDARRKES